MKSKLPTLLILALTLLIAAGAWSTLRARASTMQADAAALELDKVADLAERLRSARSTLGATDAQALDDASLVRAIERAATEAGAPPGALDRVLPRSPETADSSSLVRRSADVELTGVSFAAAVATLDALLRDVTQLRIDRLSLRATPSATETQDEWSASFTVSYLAIEAAPERR